MNELVPISPPRGISPASGAVAVPAVIANAGDRAARRFLEYFAANIRNKNTRMAYYRACCSFFAWVEHHRIGELADIEPIHVAAYIEALQVSAAGKPAVKQQAAAKPTVKQHLAAIRMLFDWLVTGQVVATNPAHAVRGPKHVVKTGTRKAASAMRFRRITPWKPISTPISRPRKSATTARLPCSAPPSAAPAH